MSLDLALNLSKVLASVAAFLYALEFILNPALIDNSSIYSHKILRLGKKGYGKSTYNFLFSTQTFKFLFLALIILSLLNIVFLTYTVVSNIICLVILIILLWTHSKNSFGKDGGDQMLVFVFICLSIPLINLESVFIKQLTMFLLAYQVMFSYLVASFSKLKGELWRNGKALTGISYSNLYGNKKLYSILIKTPFLSGILSFLVISFQLIFPITLIFPINIFLVFFLIGFLFHLFNSVVLGLNSFLFSFLSTYPSLLYLNYLINEKTTSNI